MFAYLLNLVTLICINAILAITLNFIMGYAGIFSIAHAIFLVSCIYGRLFRGALQCLSVFGGTGSDGGGGLAVTGTGVAGTARAR